jgi:hypothetical protein
MSTVTSKSKKILLQNLNNLVTDNFLSDVENMNISEIKKHWESHDFQKKMASEVFGIKGKNLTPGPKRNQSAYMFFCKKTRPEITSQHPNAKPSEVMALLGSKWRELDNQEKNIYYVEAGEDKERYLVDKELDKKKNRQPSKLSSYFLFCEDERPKIKKDHPDYSTKQATAECGKRWNYLKEHDTVKYSYYVDKAK